MKSRINGRTVTLAFAVVIVVLFSLSRSLAVEIAYPAERVCRRLLNSVRVRLTGWCRASEVEAENVTLRRQVATLELLRGENEQLVRENGRLRQALGYSARIPKSWQPAAVLSRQGGAAGAGSSLRLDRGSGAGIREGAIVISPAGLVGRVISVTLHTSQVALLSDARVKISCELGSSAGVRTLGILSGGTDELLVLRHVSGSVSEGSRVVTSGLGGICPAGIAVGTVRHIRRDEKGRVLSVEVEPAADFQSIEDVFVRREN